MSGESLAELRDELAALKEENALLRSEQQRPLHVGRVASVMRDQVASLATQATDDGDDAWGALTATTVLRETLVAACRDLEIAIRHVLDQLTAGMPDPPRDRRTTDRQPLTGGVEAPQVIEPERLPEEPVTIVVIEPEPQPERQPEPAAEVGPVELELEWLTVVAASPVLLDAGSVLGGSMNGTSAPEGLAHFGLAGRNDHPHEGPAGAGGPACAEEDPSPDEGPTSGC
jgi:hypothetical protein